MRKSTIIKDLIEMLEGELGSSPAASGTPSQRGKVKYIDKDWGQLTMEQPPVGWPCILIDIEQVEIRPLADGNEHAKATVALTVANKRTNSSSAHAPRGAKEKSMETIDLTDDVHRLVQGFAAEGAGYSPFQVVSFYKLNDLPGAEVYAMRYCTRYNVAPPLMAV